MPSLLSGETNLINDTLATEIELFSTHNTPIALIKWYYVYYAKNELTHWGLLIPYAMTSYVYLNICDILSIALWRRNFIEKCI